MFYGTIKLIRLVSLTGGFENKPNLQFMCWTF